MREIGNRQGRPTTVLDLKAGGEAFTPPPIREGNTLHGIDGPDIADFVRLSIFLRDLNRCRRWIELSAYEDPEVRDALDIAALITFCTCFESTSGHRVRPLKIRKIYQPEDRQRFKELLEIRNKFIAHDDQSVPINSVAIELDGSAFAHNLSSGIGVIPLRAMNQFDKFASLVELAHGYVYAERDRVADDVIRKFNQMGGPVREKIKASEEFKIAIAHALPGATSGEGNPPLTLPPQG